MSAGSTDSEASRPLRLHLAENVTNVLANGWTLLRHRKAGGNLQQKGKKIKSFLLHRCRGIESASCEAVYGKTFLSFGQAGIFWLYLIFKVLKLIVGCISFLTRGPRLCSSLWYAHCSLRLWQHLISDFCFAGRAGEWGAAPRHLRAPRGLPAGKGGRGVGGRGSPGDARS